jgi:hypothetical protein
MRTGTYISSFLIVVVVAIAEVTTADNTTTSLVVDYTSTPLGNNTATPVVDGTRTTAYRTNVYDIALAGLILSGCVVVFIVSKCFFDWKVQQQCPEIHTDPGDGFSPEVALSIDRVPWTGEIYATENVHPIGDGRHEDVHPGEREGTSSLAETISIKDSDLERNQSGEGTTHPADTKTISVLPL